MYNIKDLYNMAFTDETITAIKSYIDAHLADWNWHKERFDFISNKTLQLRLADEFISTRYIYKMLEGLNADEWLLRAQIRLQVLTYASIYEAVLHHILFTEIPSNTHVQALTEFETKKEISIPQHQKLTLTKALNHDGKDIIPTYKSTVKIDVTKVRFDKKAECAEKLGLINAKLKDEIIELYEARNAIHIHAEIKKNLEYQLDLSKRAYMRMEPFIMQIKENLPKVLANQN